MYTDVKISQLHGGVSPEKITKNTQLSITNTRTRTLAHTLVSGPNSPERERKKEREDRQLVKQDNRSNV